MALRGPQTHFSSLAVLVQRCSFLGWPWEESPGRFWLSWLGLEASVTIPVVGGRLASVHKLWVWVEGFPLKPHEMLPAGKGFWEKKRETLRTGQNEKQNYIH